MDWGYPMNRVHPAKLIKIAAHHNEFAYMLWKMEYGAGNKPNNRFSILNGDHNEYIDVVKDFESIERSNGKCEQTFGVLRYSW